MNIFFKLNADCLKCLMILLRIIVLVFKIIEVYGVHNGKTCVMVIQLNLYTTVK